MSFLNDITDGHERFGCTLDATLVADSEEFVSGIEEIYQEANEETKFSFQAITLISIVMMSKRRGS
jgi:hypothetical protein